MIGPFSHNAMSMLWASKSPVTPLPATALSSRHRPSPPCGRSLRDGPVLQELRAIVKDPAEAVFVEKLLQQHDGRNAPVVVPDHVGHVGLLYGIHHRLGLFRGSAERLFAEDHLAGFRCSNRNLGVSVVRAGDIDEVDIFARNQSVANRFRSIDNPSSPQILLPDRRCAHKLLSIPVDRPDQKSAVPADTHSNAYVP